MNRRSFLKNILGAVAAVVLPTKLLHYDPVKAKVITPPPADYILMPYEGEAFMETGVIYAPYIPLYVTDMIGPPSASFENRYCSVHKIQA